MVREREGGSGEGQAVAMDPTGTDRLLCLGHVYGMPTCV